jgi:hypothetical protein
MDIVERLHESPCSGDIGCAHKLCVEAANEIERLREALNADNQTIRLHLGEMTQQEMRTVKAAFAWVLSCAALKEGSNG